MPLLAPARVAQNKFSGFFDSGVITLPIAPLIGPQHLIFTIGSCFAEEIRIALAAIGLRLGPDYRALAFDPEQSSVDELPERNHLNYYNAFTVLNEFRRAEGSWTQQPDDFWAVGGKGGKRYQDPYRRLVFGRSAEALRAVTVGLNALMAESIRSADAFMITYGMTEVFRKRSDGLVVCQRPLYAGGGGAQETEFWQSGFDDNLAAVRETVAIITRLRPEAKIFMTVSPVPLDRTFSGRDVYAASFEGKSTLRAVLGQIEREYDNVAYFPAYEAVTSFGARGFDASDGRHVRRIVVGAIMNAFVMAYVQNPEAYATTPPPSRLKFIGDDLEARFAMFRTRKLKWARKTVRKLTGAVAPAAGV